MVHFRSRHFIRACVAIGSTIAFFCVLLLLNTSDYYSKGGNHDFNRYSWKIVKPTEVEATKKTDKPAEQTIIEHIQQQIPSLPIVQWNILKNKKLKVNSTCALFPDLFNMEYSNSYWQMLHTSNGTFQFFGAYLDVRKNNANGPTIRILGMIDKVEPAVKTYCHIWFENRKGPEIVPVFEYKYVWVKAFGNAKDGAYQPYLLACRIPKTFWNGSAPLAVSIVEKPCDTSRNLLNVFYNVPKGPKKDFGVCVKGLNFPYTDLSIRLAEWIETLNLLGADKIFFYELAVHPNVKKMLTYYEKQGKVHVTPLKLAGNQPSHPLLQYYFLSKKIVQKRQNELVPYNDCFYKHMYEYKYIILLDTDEIIMPLKENSWKKLMNTVSEKSKDKIRSHYIVQNVYFLDDALHRHGWFADIPKSMHMLQHVYRSEHFTKPGHYVKSFFNTEKTLTLHNHAPFACLGGCLGYSIDKEDAQLQHYRESCVAELRKVCDDFMNNTVIDTTLWKFKEPLIRRMLTALRDLGYPESDIYLKHD